MFQTITTALLLVSFSTPAWCQPKSNWADLFRARFYTHYQENRCKQNVTDLLQAGKALGLNLRDIQVVQLTNPGISNGGLIGAKWGRAISSPNWFFHVFAISDGRVLDFDFGREPTLLPWDAYLRKMFITPAMLESQRRLESSVGSYQFSVYNGLDYFRYEIERVPGVKPERQWRWRESPQFDCNRILSGNP